MVRLYSLYVWLWLPLREPITTHIFWGQLPLDTHAQTPAHTQTHTIHHAANEAEFRNSPPCEQGQGDAAGRLKPEGPLSNLISLLRPYSYGEVAESRSSCFLLLNSLTHVIRYCTTGSHPRTQEGRHLHQLTSADVDDVTANSTGSTTQTCPPPRSPYTHTYTHTHSDSSSTLYVWVCVCLACMRVLCVSKCSLCVSGELEPASG
jgi:hypothetical protein